MTIGASIFLIAVGAILYFATDFDLANVSVSTIGLILMIVGVAGLLIGLFLELIWSRRSGRGGYVDRRDPPPY
jgi:cytochrome c oxidase subunit IV